MNKTTARLADGREIIYFDESEHPIRCLVDNRRLPPFAPASFLRYDVLSDEWVTIAAHRQDRTYLPPPDECPLCPSVNGHQSEIPSPEYDVVVFENRFPSFSSPSDLPTPPDIPSGPLVATGPIQQPAAGRCEVVCFTSDHDSAFSALPAARVRTVLEAWIDRTEVLSARPGILQVFCFENRGQDIGVTLSHPHGQIYGYPFVTPRTGRMMESARRYRGRTERNLFADVLAGELDSGDRVVAHTEHWTAFVPSAARWPIEVHLYPNQPAARLPDLSEAQRHDFCPVYLDLLGRLEAAHGPDVPYIAAWQQTPGRADDDLALLHLEISSIRRAPGKVKYLAGSEAVMGSFINDVVPEDAASVLRGAVSGPPTALPHPTRPAPDEAWTGNAVG